MNTMQYEQLFTDLNPTQAETIAAGVIDPGGGQASSADASYGEAAASFRHNTVGSAFTDLFVKDTLKDGYAVYAKVHGLTPNGQTVVGSTKFFDRRGAVGSGTRHIFTAKLSPIVRKFRVAIYRENRSGFVAGRWVDMLVLNPDD